MGLPVLASSLLVQHTSPSGPLLISLAERQDLVSLVDGGWWMEAKVLESGERWEREGQDPSLFLVSSALEVTSLGFRLVGGAVFRIHGLALLTMLWDLLPWTGSWAEGVGRISQG